jgi:hypothetical protein
MNMRDIPKLKSLHEKSRELAMQSDRDSSNLQRYAISRRQFARSAVSATIIGAALGTGLLKPANAQGRGPFTPVPIPGGTPALGGGFHVFGPTPDGSFDPIDAEPATITNFNGFVGLTYVDGMVTQTNTSTGEVRRLPFVASDMRFMKGDFRATDGKVHQGAFALV